MPNFDAIRDWMNRRRVPVGVALALLVVVLVARAWTRLSDHVVHENGAWWYDLENKRYFEHTLTVPPIKSPWGHDAAIVYFYGCGGCGDERRFVGYYFKLGPEAQRRVKENPALVPAAMGPAFPGRMYSLDAVNWVDSTDPGAAGMGKALGKRCQPPDYLRECQGGPPAR